MKKKLLILLSVLSVMTMTAFGAGCELLGGAGENSTSVNSSSSSAPESSEEKTPSITLSNAELSLEVYSSATLTVDLENSEEAIVWTSSDESVAKVADGVVTAYKAGTATITATAGTIKATCQVTVTAGAENPVFSNLEEEITLFKDGVETLDVSLTYKGEAFTMATVSVTTEGDKITVSDNYEVTAVDYGTQAITVTAKVGDVTIATATVTVEVIQFGAVIVDLPENHLDLVMGEEGYDLASVQAQFNGEPVAVSELQVDSTDDNVVTLEDGKLVPIGAGEATVTISFTKDGATYDAVITVSVTKLNDSKEIGFLVQGDAGKDSVNTGNATIDLTGKEIELSEVTKVYCNEEEIVFSVEGNALTLTNAPGGYQLYTLVTPSKEYTIDGTVYNYSISTAEELLEWRENAHTTKGYTILANDIDMAGAELPELVTQLFGTFDGRGYTISNFVFTEKSGFLHYVHAGATVKNVQFVNVVQDCNGQAEGNPIREGVFGENLMGTLENVLIKMTVVNMLENTEHWGLVTPYLSATAVAKNIVAYAEAVDCSPKFFHGFAGGDGQPIINNAHLCTTISCMLTGLMATNSGAHESVQAMINTVGFENWEGLWQVDANGEPFMSDYTDNVPFIELNGATVVNATVSFETTSFYPLTYTLAEEIAGVSIEGNQLSIDGTVEVGTEIKVSVTCENKPEWNTSLTYTIEKEIVNVQGLMLAQGNAGRWAYNTGVAKIDFTDKNVDIANVKAVTIDGVTYDYLETVEGEGASKVGYRIEGNNLVLNNVPGGNHVFVLSTPTQEYIVKACVYGLGISTVEELEAWRTSESMWYAVLLNDIDYNGATLTDGANVLGTLDGRGYKISNFTTKSGFIHSLYAAESAIKNVYFYNVTQDCSAWTGAVDHGVLGQRNKGMLENIYLDVHTINLSADHYGVVCFVMEAGSKIHNVVVEITSSSTKAHYAMLQDNALSAGESYGVVGSYANSVSESTTEAAWGVSSGFHQQLDWMVAEEASDELRTFTSSYWEIDPVGCTITMKPW